MTQEEIKREKIVQLQGLLSEAKQKGSDVEQAEFLHEHGVEVREESEWIVDDSYKGKNKKIYVCSKCNHWQSIYGKNKDSILYKRYCPFCGRRMKVSL